MFCPAGSSCLRYPMLKATTHSLQQHTIFPLFPTLHSQDQVFTAAINNFSSEAPFYPSLSCSLSKLRRISAASKEDHQEQTSELSGVKHPQLFGSEDENEAISDEGYGILQAIPHVAVASMSNFLFGYHIGYTPPGGFAKTSHGNVFIPDHHKAWQCVLKDFVLEAADKSDEGIKQTCLFYTRVMNGPIVSIAKELGFEGNSFLEGLVVSIFIAGAFIGSISAGSIVDKLGFRKTFQVDTIPLILGAVISAQAHSLNEILLGRFLVGLGIGVNNVLVPIYISEVAPTKHRGSLGTVSQIGTCLGIIASLSLAISSESDPHWWRLMLYIASIPGFFLFFGMQFAVESPRWLCKAGQLDEAANVVKNIWGPSEVNKAIEEFQSVLRNDGADLDSSWLELLEEPHSRVAFIGGTLFLLQQFAGINAVLYFSSLTFVDVGIRSSALASLYVGLMYFAGALFASYLIEKQGRQTLLIGSYLGMAVSMFVVASVVGLPVEKDIGVNLTILGTIMYIICFAFGAGPVTGLIIPELSSSRTRGKVMGFSMSVHWVCNFLVGLFFLEVVERFGLAPVYAGFGGVSLLTAAFAFYFTVETKGRSLEEIEMSLYSNLQSKDN